MKTTNIFYRALCLVLMALCSVCGFAQSEFGKVSPQTADFIRQGNIPVSLYTGQVNVSIPLYHIKDRDFDIPIALNYAGDGLKPNRRHGWAGLNWSVSGAGSISREVYYGPDDYADWYHADGVNINGLWWAANGKPYDPEDLYDFSALTCSGLSGCHIPHYNGYYDSNPDLFMFSVPGHSGRFLIGSDGNVLCSGMNYKVDLSGLGKQRYESGVIASQIKVTSPDGYIYTFGNTTDVHPLEYSINFSPTETYGQGQKKSCINAWHLTRIEAPNGRTVRFNYTAGNELVGSPFMQSTCTENPTGTNTPDLGDDYSCRAVKTVLLESIEVEDTGLKVEFANNIEDCRTFYYNHAVDDKYNANGYQLDTVRVKRNGELLYTCTLEYEDRSRFRFLKKVTMHDGGTYTMDYNHPTAYPEPLTGNVDEYDYWTQHGGTAYSLMDKLTYPTGGHTTFAYERHTYGKKVQKTVSDGVLTSTLTNTTGTLNSFRIKRMEHVPVQTGDSRQMSQIQEYSYLNTDGTGSGTLLRSRILIETDGNFDLTVNEWKSNYNIEEPAIGYSYVKEAAADGSYTLYRFSDYASNPDSGDTAFHWNSTDRDNAALSIAFSSASLNASRWDRRGLPVQTDRYDSNGTLKQRVRNSYLYVNPQIPLTPEEEEKQGIPPYTTAIFPIANGAMAMKLGPVEHPMVKETVTEYAGNGTKETERFFLRNSDGQLWQQRELTSMGDTLKTFYTYPKEMEDAGTVGNIHYNMVQKNMVDFPIWENTGLNGTPLNTVHHVYKSDVDGLIATDSVIVSRGTAGIQQWERHAVHDTYGNPVHIVYSSGAEEVLVWGYTGRYVVARIEGLSYSKVQTALGVAPESLSSASVPNMETLDALRIALPSAQVTTYTYSPQVGVTSITAPNGEVTTYTYNSSGELSSVSDHNGNIVETYSKHYRN